MWHRSQITLRSRLRGFHLVTDELLARIPEVAEIGVGLAHFHLCHTSASLFVNENADPDVRTDFESWSARLAPESEPYYVHVAEGPDDMPAHIKSGVFGIEVTLPVDRGRLAVGIWQGIYLGEHRDRAGPRQVVATLWGEGR